MRGHAGGTMECSISIFRSNKQQRCVNAKYVMASRKTARLSPDGDKQFYLRIAKKNVRNPATKPWNDTAQRVSSSST